MLPVVLIGPLTLLWLPLTRTRRVRLLVAGLMIATMAGAVLLVAVLPRGRFEITAVALLITVAAVGSASVVEHRRLRNQPRPRRIGWLRPLCTVVLLIAVGIYGALLKPTPVFPPTDTVPPPTGLRAAVQPGGDCGSGSCTRIITVTGRPGQSPAALHDEVERHLRARGWGPVADRPAGCWTGPRPASS